MRTLSMTDAREQLTKLPEVLMEDGIPEIATITRHGKRVLAVMPWDIYESLMETLDILRDHEMMEAIRQGERDMQTGRVVPLDEALAELGWA